MMILISDLRAYLKTILKKKGRVIKVTTVHYYEVPEHERMTDEALAKEWFERFHVSHRHVYRDNHHISESPR